MLCLHRALLMVMVSFVITGCSCHQTSDKPQVSSTQSAQSESDSDSVREAVQEHGDPAPTTPDTHVSETHVLDAAVTAELSDTPDVDTEDSEDTEGSETVEAHVAEVQNAEELRQVGDALQRAVAAAEQVQGDSRCDTAYRMVSVMGRELRQVSADNLADLPSREQFIRVCEELPEEVQQCMVLTYAMQHQAECERVQKNMSPEDVERYQSMVASE